MKIGTKSVLFGYHCFLLHWFFVARGWYRLNKFNKVFVGYKLLPKGGSLKLFTSLYDPRLWVAFFIHDLGYWGKPNMDGPEGETHPYWAGRKMAQWFGEPWGQFTQYHSRFLSKKDGVPVSALCYADKLAICLYPDWLYLKLIFATGEVHEYMKNSTRMIGATASHTDAVQWLMDVKVYVRQWVEEHKDGRTDTWTPAAGYGSNGGITDREIKTHTGVWK